VKRGRGCRPSSSKRRGVRAGWGAVPPCSELEVQKLREYLEKLPSLLSPPFSRIAGEEMTRTGRRAIIIDLERGGEGEGISMVLSISAWTR